MLPKKRQGRVAAPLLLCVMATRALAEDIPPAEQTLDLKFQSGGGLGQILSLEMQGTPDNLYWIIISLTQGPWNLPDGWAPDQLCVGTDLLNISLSIPGFYAVMPATGSVSLPLPIPPDPAFDGIVLNFQALDFSPQGGASLGGSNPYRVTFQESESFASTLTDLEDLRSGHTTTLLDDGRVLVTGGADSSIFDPFGQESAEIYIMDAERFEPIADMNYGRVWHTATKLQDGRVLLAGGGLPGSGLPTASAEIFDPSTGAFQEVGSMSEPRGLHAASLLPDGRVLISGGADSLNGLDVLTQSLDSTDIFDPITETFSPGPDLSEPKVGHTSTILESGEILITAGYSHQIVLGLPVPEISKVAQIFRSATGVFSNPITMVDERFGHTATRLNNGEILIVGGASGAAYNPAATDRVESFDPVTETFTNRAPMNFGRALHETILLGDGRILILGGADGTLLSPIPVDYAEKFYPQIDSYVVLESMGDERAYLSALLLPDDTVLITGGTGGVNALPLQSAEIFQN